MTKYNKVSFYLDDPNLDENPIWGVCEAGYERLVRKALAIEYEVEPDDLTWLETAEYLEDPDEYLSDVSENYPGVWL